MSYDMTEVSLNRSPGDSFDERSDKSLESGELESHLMEKWSLTSIAKDEYPNRFVMFSAGCASLNSILLGYDIGVFGGAMIYIRDEYNLSDFEYSFVISILNMMAILGAAVSAVVSDRYGRTKTLFTASILFFIGNLLMAASTNYAILLIGRIFCGFGVGTGLAIDPLYISEMSPARYRGGLVSLSEMSINIGITLGFLFDYIFSFLPVNVAWRMMLAVGCVIPVIMMYLSYCLMSETPRWLLSQSRTNEASKVLSKMTNSFAEAELTKKQILESIEYERNMKTSWKEIFQNDPVVRRMLLIIIGVGISQQLSGIETVMYYTPVILEHAGVSTRSQELGIQALMGLFKTLSLILTAYLLDRPGSTGRRLLLLISLPGCGLSLLFLGISYRADNLPLSVFSLFSYVFFFSLGVGPVCWLLLSEVLPLHVRAKGMSIATSLNRITSATTALTYLPLVNLIGDDGTFYFYGALCGACTLFAYLCVPETKGKTLEEMTDYFSKTMGYSKGSSERVSFFQM